MTCKDVPVTLRPTASAHVPQHLSLLRGFLRASCSVPCPVSSPRKVYMLAAPPRLACSLPSPGLPAQQPLLLPRDQSRPQQPRGSCSDRGRRGELGGGRRSTGEGEKTQKPPRAPSGHVSDPALPAGETVTPGNPACLVLESISCMSLREGHPALTLLCTGVLCG